MEVDLEALPIGEDASNVVVEVPVGSRNKYKYEPEMGTVMLDCVLLGNVRGRIKALLDERTPIYESPRRGSPVSTSRRCRRSRWPGWPGASASTSRCRAAR